MSTASGSHPLLALLDMIGSPMVLFGPEGQVVFANQAARRLPSRPALVLPSDPRIRQQVRQVIQLQVDEPVTLRVQVHADQGVSELDCAFPARPVANLAVMLITPVEASEGTGSGSGGDSALPDRLSLPQIMQLLRSEIVPPMQAVMARAHEAASDPRGLADGVQHLSDRLTRLIDLVDVFGDDALIGEDRVLMPEMLKAVCTELVPLTRARGVSVLIEDHQDQLPPVYGSQRLLHRAVHECLHNAIEHARGGVADSQPVAVRVAFAVSGQHLQLAVHSLGAVTAAVLNRHAATLFRANPGLPASGSQQGLRIGLPLAQRILQLHGGHLRVDDDDGELAVRLEVPTGAPMRNTHHLDLLQAQIYAEDLSKLMARSRKPSRSNP
ncbi:sensor histidine kinase KdpD [uncultured Hydrogenophaga sp.]|uniref:sensor histidine kinase n=1 Tax=uncultured Hydrogenophaga sp. TaxID=199683 RepID=UPI0026602722|nr:ATP-binding protein [uncultured Hydrogenophaga sp.]